MLKEWNGQDSNGVLGRLGVSMMLSVLDSKSALSLKKWVLENWNRSSGIVQIVTQDSPQRQLLMEKASQAFRSRNGVDARLRTWFNVQMPDHSPGKYPDIYPHVHNDDKATTLVIYLDPGDVPSPLDIIENGKVVATITPEEGMGVFIPNGVYHAVHKNRGTRDRVALICTAYPR